MYPEEIEFLTSAPFWIGVGLLALLWLILRTIAKAWLMREYRKDPEALIARMERNRQGMRDDDDWLFDDDDEFKPTSSGIELGAGVDECGYPAVFRKNH